MSVVLPLFWLPFLCRSFLTISVVFLFLFCVCVCVFAFVFGFVGFSLFCCFLFCLFVVFVLLLACFWRGFRVQVALGFCRVGRLL